MNKGFVISEKDLILFQDWINQPDSVKKILEHHSKVLEACKRIDRVMNSFTKEQLTTPFAPIL